MVFESFSGYIQGDINTLKLYTCNTGALMSGLHASSPIDRVVLAVVDNITFMWTLKTMVTTWFQLSGIPLGGEAYICGKIQENIDSTTSVIGTITTNYIQSKKRYSYFSSPYQAEFNTC